MQSTQGLDGESGDNIPEEASEEDLTALHHSSVSLHNHDPTDISNDENVTEDEIEEVDRPSEDPVRASWADSSGSSASVEGNDEERSRCVEGRDLRG